MIFITKRKDIDYDYSMQRMFNTQRTTGFI